MVRAALVAVLNYVLWILLPQILASRLSEAASSFPLTGTLILSAGAVITGLQVLGALTEGGALSAIFNGGSYLVVAYYFYQASDAGVIDVTTAGLTIQLRFTTLLMLILLPSLFNAVRTWITYLLDQGEGAAPMADEVRG